MIKVYCDGGSRGNPGEAAAAFVIFKNDKEIARGSKYLGITTNNNAEYQAVIIALRYIAENLSPAATSINLDSELVTKQLSGLYKVKNKNLKALFQKAKALEKTIGTKVNYTWSKRENNRLADLLVNQELDKQEK